MSDYVNLPILLIALFFAILETIYFGGNMTPQSPAEVICDGIVCLITALAFVGRAW